MVDFLKHLDPEARARIERRRQAFERDVAKFAAMGDQELCEKTEFYLANCQFPLQHPQGEPVYDGTMAHVIIPELIRRLRKGQP